MNTPRLAASALVAAAALTALAGCSEPATPAQSAAPAASSASSLSGSIIVDAAASLNVVFPAMAKSFEAANPGTTVTFNFGGSSDLAASIVSGSPADVFAAASDTTMATVTDAKRNAATPITVAQNELEIATPPGDPGGVTGLADFADASKTIVVCAKEVPCGAAAQKVFGLARITAKPDSYEQSVSAVLTKVETGEADAGLVYVTDVKGAGDKVKGITFPEAAQAITAYPIAPLTDSKNPALAQAFTDYVVDHQADLRAAGFLAP